MPKYQISITTPQGVMSSVVDLSAERVGMLIRTLDYHNKISTTTNTHERTKFTFGGLAFAVQGYVAWMIAEVPEPSKVPTNGNYY